MPFTDAPAREPVCRHLIGNRLLREYVAVNGRIPHAITDTLGCHDVHLLAQSLARSSYLAAADMKLLELDAPPRSALLPFTRRSLRLAYVLGGLTLLTLLGFCWFIAGLIL